MRPNTIINNNKFHFITLFSLIIFCLYLFINILFPYANIISTVFLSIGTGLLLYSLLDINETILTFSLVCVLLSIIFALSHYLIIT